MSSLRWSEEQLQEYEARAGRRNTRPACENAPQSTLSPLDDERPDPISENALQDKIEGFCTEWGFYWFHDRSRGKNKPGHPDLVIAMKGGRTLWIELKSKSGRLTADQKRVRLMLMQLGHEFHEVRSFKRFLEVVNGD